MTDDQLSELKKEIFYYIDDTWYDYEVLPHQGLVVDFRARFYKLSELVLTLIDPDCDWGLVNPDTEWMEYEQRHAQRL